MSTQTIEKIIETILSGLTDNGQQILKIANDQEYITFVAETVLTEFHTRAKAEGMSDDEIKEFVLQMFVWGLRRGPVFSNEKAKNKTNPSVKDSLIMNLNKLRFTDSRQKKSKQLANNDLTIVRMMSSLPFKVYDVSAKLVTMGKLSNIQEASVHPNFWYPGACAILVDDQQYEEWCEHWLRTFCETVKSDGVQLDYIESMKTSDSIRENSLKKLRVTGKAKLDKISNDYRSKYTKSLKSEM